MVERSLLHFTPWLQLEPFWRRLRPAFRLGNLLHCVPTLESASTPFDVFCFLRHDTKWCLWWLKQRWKVLQGQGKESLVDYCTSPVPGGKGSVGGGREGSPFHSNWSYCSKALSEALNTNIAFTAGCSTRGSSSLLMLPGDKTNESIPSETNQPTNQPTPKPKPRHSLVVLDIFWPNLLSFQQSRGLIYGVQCHSWHTQSYKYWHTVLFQIDLTTFALKCWWQLDLWSPMRQFQLLHSQVYMDCAICLFTFDFLPLNNRFMRYMGVLGLIQQGTTPLVLDTRSLSWGFLLGFWWCLTSESWSQGLPPCHQGCSENRENSQTF